MTEHIYYMTVKIIVKVAMNSFCHCSLLNLKSRVLTI